MTTDSRQAGWSEVEVVAIDGIGIRSDILAGFGAGLCQRFRRNSLPSKVVVPRKGKALFIMLNAGLTAGRPTMAQLVLSIIGAPIIHGKKTAMKILSTLILLIIAIASCIFSPVLGQTSTGKYEFGAQAGVFAYQGDLSPSPIGSYKTLRPAIGISAARRLGDRYSIRLGLNLGRIAGDEGKYKTPAWRQERNLRFSTPVTELAGHFIWKPFGDAARVGAWTPYAALGGGLALLRIRPDASGVNGIFASSETGSIAAQLAADMARPKPRIMPSLQMGAGIRYQFRPQWALQAETSYRYLPTDYLDGFSKAVNPDTRDQYMTHAVGVIFCSGRGGRMACPKNVF